MSTGNVSMIMPEMASYEPERGEITPTVLAIWSAVAFVSLGAVMAGQAFAGLIFIAAAGLFHSMIRPAVGVYALVALIVLEPVMSLIPKITTFSKVAGLWVLVLSLPRLTRAVTGGKWDRTAKWMLLFLGWSALSLLWAPIKLMALQSIQSLLLQWGMILLVCLWISNERLWNEMRLVYVVSCLVFAVIIMQTGDVSAALESRGSRIHATSLVSTGEAWTMRDLNGPARLTGIAALACLSYILTAWGRPRLMRKLLVFGALLILCAAVVIFKGRAVYLGLPVAWVGGMLVCRGQGMGRRILMVAGSFVIGAALVWAGSASGLLGEGIRERYESIFEQGATAGNRLTMWKGHMGYFFSTGLRGLGVGQVRWTPESLYHVAHNDFIDIAGNLGIIGVAAFAAIHLSIGLRIRNAIGSSHQLFFAMTWVFLLFVGIPETDYRSKVFALPIAMILSGLRLAEQTRHDMPALSGYPGGAWGEVV